MNNPMPLITALAATFGAFITLPALAASFGTPPPAEFIADKFTHTLETLKEIDRTAVPQRALNIQTWKTDEGAKVIFVEARELPMFDLRLIFAAGSSQDQTTPGIANLTNTMLNKGANDKDINGIAHGFDGVGAIFYDNVSQDSSELSLRSLSAPHKRETALNLLADIVGKPTFPEEALARSKDLLLTSFTQWKQTPNTLADNKWLTRLYGDHPYGRSTYGTAESVQSISTDQLKAFHAKAYTASNAVIVMVGDLSRAEAQTIATQLSSVLPKGPALPDIAQPVQLKPSKTHIEFASSQTHLLLGHLGIARNDPDYAALRLATTILGGAGFGSRLMTELRDKRGLTYGVFSLIHTWKAPGPFKISLNTRAELSENTLKLVQETVRDFLASGPTQKEFDEAKRSFSGSLATSRANNLEVLQELAYVAVHDLPPTHMGDLAEQYRNITLEQVKTVMNNKLSLDKMSIVTVGPTVAQAPLPPPLGEPVELTLSGQRQ